MNPINDKHAILMRHKNTWVDSRNWSWLKKKRRQKFINLWNKLLSHNSILVTNLKTSVIFFFSIIAASVGFARRRNDTEVLCRRNKIRKNFASRWRQCGVKCVKKSRKILEKDGDESGTNTKAVTMPEHCSKLVGEVRIKGRGDHRIHRKQTNTSRSLRFTSRALCCLQGASRFASQTFVTEGLRPISLWCWQQHSCFQVQSFFYYY